jgi:DNA polymerase/3'-5' exonuclease PolX
MTNAEIADKLNGYARELRHRHENLFRVKAYRKAAEVVLRLGCPVDELVHAKGRKALARIPGIGRHLAETISLYVETGEWRTRN